MGWIGLRLLEKTAGSSVASLQLGWLSNMGDSGHHSQQVLDQCAFSGWSSFPALDDMVRCWGLQVSSATECDR
jgi:hypothetical protein